MPEALAVIFVFVTIIVVHVAAWIRSRDPSHYDPRQELERLQQQEAWLSQRLQVAQKENLDQRMIAKISAELGETSLQLARVTEQPQPR